ncbi:MAG: hypothetical protein IT454_07735, partial [Planctomycetes bacterium]|nr:hypothetical protein [Planctomycetota bacterium]
MNLRPSSVALAATFLCLSAAAQQRPVTDSPHDSTNFNVETTRGFVWSASGQIYALNTFASQVVVHANLDGTIDAQWQTVNQPVAIAEWRNDRILVIGAGSHALAVHDRTTGALLDIVALPSEPADIVVDPDSNLAFISCQGRNVLVQVDLNNLNAAPRVIDVPAERPRFLSFDRGALGNPADNRVYVAPFTSGNDSLVEGVTSLDFSQSAEQQLGRVVPGASVNKPRADVDLFVIDSSNPAAPLQTAMKAAGTLITAHGRNPVTQQHWLLNVDSNNADPNLNTEPELNGNFAKNRVSIGTPVAGATPLPSTTVDIDDTNLGAPVVYSPSQSLSFPFGLAFHATGVAAVSASTSDRIAAFDPFGNRYFVFDVTLAPGSIPRHLQWDPWGNSFLAVHAWGRNVIEILQAGLPAPVATLQLGVDPTPQIVRDGRAIWYDADLSLNGRSSCNTCHPGGKSDMIAWSISDAPHDFKDPMATQSLLSIEDTFPYHWRGERDLVAFNGAFTGLLGGARALTTGANSEFEKFQTFIFSLQAQANPYEDLSRNVTVSAGVLPGQPTGTSALRGLSLYQNSPTFGSLSCVDCHAFPNGSSGDHQLIDLSFVPSQTTIEVAHFREMTHRDQPNVGGAPRSGLGLTHNGTAAGLVEAASRILAAPQDQHDMGAFLRQFDNGISPAAHAAFDLSSANVGAIAANLVPQAASLGIDIVAFGEAVPSGSTTPLQVRWLFEPTTNTFLASENGIAPMSLAQLVPGASASSPLWAVVLGVPAGNGRRFALDPDNDTLVDTAETAAATNRWNPDSDNDGYPDGYEVANGSSPISSSSKPVDTTPPAYTVAPRNGLPRFDFSTTKLAKFFVESTEPARVDVAYFANGVPVKYVSSTRYELRHTIVLQDLESGTSGVLYTAKFQLVDRAGLASNSVTLQFSTQPIITAPARNSGFMPPTIRILSNTAQRAAVAPPNTLVVQNSAIQLEMREPGSVPSASVTGHQVIAQVLIRRNGSSTWTSSPNFTSPNATVLPIFTVAFFGSTPVPFNIYTGAFLVSAPVSASGLASLNFSQPGLNQGDEVRLNVLGIALPPAIPGATFEAFT